MKIAYTMDESKQKFFYDLDIDILDHLLISRFLNGPKSHSIQEVSKWVHTLMNDQQTANKGRILKWVHTLINGI